MVITCRSIAWADVRLFPVLAVRSRAPWGEGDRGAFSVKSARRRP